MGTQLKIDFDTNSISESYKENCLYNWCIKNHRKDILDDWNDNSYSIYKITYASNKKVKWKCHVCCNEWEDSINHRTISNRGCSICNKKRVASLFSTVKDINDSVLIKYPLIAQEWSPKNDRGPETYYPSSNKEVWFICSKCGNEYKKGISKRCIRGQGCSICSRYKVVAGKNDLFTTNPELKLEWDFENNTINPETINSSSKEKVNWICLKGHRWPAIVYSRAINKYGCPKCNAERRTSLPEKIIYYYIKKYFSDAIENYHPAFLSKKEIDVFIPSLKIGIEYDGKNWHKDFNKDLKKDKLCRDNGIELIRIREEGCPNYDSPSILINVGKYKNDFLYLKEPLKMLLNHLNIHNPIINLDYDINFIMEQFLTLEKENSISKNSRIMLDWDFEKNKGINPDYISIYSNRKFNWKCHICGYSWSVSPAHRSRGHNCPSCMGQIVIEGKNDLLSQFPNIAKEWDYGLNEKKPNEVSAHSNKKAHWICSICNHRWEATIYSRTSGCGCPECKKKKISNKLSKAPREKSLGIKFPNLLKDWDFENNKVSPYEIYPNANIIVNWKCHDCHNNWAAYVYSRTKTKGSNCPYCSGRFAITGVNDLATEHPELMSDWDFNKNTLDPTKEKSGSSKNAYWLCSKCGHSWDTKINIRTRGCGCPKCGQAKTTKSSKKQIICIENNQVFDSLSSAAKTLNISINSISNCLTGRCISAGGYHWKYKN